MIVEPTVCQNEDTTNEAETNSAAYTLKIRGGADTYMKSDGKIGTAGKGALIQIEKSATLSTMQDQVLFQPIRIVNSSGNDICGTIDSHYYLGCGCRGGVEREIVAYEIISNKE